MTIIWCMVPEIWSKTDKMFHHLDHFHPLYPLNNPKNQYFEKKGKKCTRRYHFTQVYQKLWSYSILFLRYGLWQIKFLFLSLGYFLPLYPLKSQEYQYFFKKMKTTSGDIIIFHMCTKNYDQMMYGSWDMVCNWQMDRQTGRLTDKQKKWNMCVSIWSDISY